MEPSQRSLFNPGEGARLRDIAIERVAQGADALWKRMAIVAVHEVAVEKAAFTTDEVEAKLAEMTTRQPKDKRALGAIMRAAATIGLILATERVKPSKIPQNDRRPKRVWLSLVTSPHRAATAAAGG